VFDQLGAERRPDRKMKVSRSEFLRRAFVLSEEDIRILSEKLGVLGEVEYKLDCSDGLLRSAHTLDDVLRFDNSPARSIVKISFASHGSHFGSSASIELASEGSNNLRIHLEGPEEVIVNLNREIDVRLAAMRPWYDILTRGDAVNMVFAFCGAFLLLIVAAVAFAPDRLSAAPASDPRREARGAALAVITMTAFGGLAWLLHRTRNWLFPIGSLGPERPATISAKRFGGRWSLGSLYL
jgi:hypothetical protein